MDKNIANVWRAVFCVLHILYKTTKLPVRAVKNVLEIIRESAIITIGDTQPDQAPGSTYNPDPTTTRYNPGKEIQM